MAAKEVRFGADARSRMLRGVDVLADSVKVTLKKLEAGGAQSDPERAFITERVRALNSFFNVLDTLFSAIARLEHLGQGTIQTVLKILR